MKVLHVLGSMDPAHGGPPAVASRLAAAETAAGHTVTIASHEAPGRQQAIDASLKGIPHMQQVRMINLPAGLTLRAIVPAKTVRILRDLLKDSDILHLHGVWEPLVRRAATEARRLSIPYIITAHGVLDPWSLQQRRLKKRIALALGYRKMLQNAGCLHLLNQDEADLIKPLVLHCPMRVIPNGVFLEEIDPLPAEGTFRAARPELRGDPYILFLSRLHYKKGLDFLADAFGKIASIYAGRPQSPNHPAVRLVVAGPDGGAKTDFENRIAQHGLSDRVHMVGPLYGRDKIAAMVDAAVFCLPSRQEGFSMAITEAMACSCPVVVSEACHFPEVASAGAGEVVPLEVDRIAAALDRVLADPQRRRDMGQAGRRLVLSTFTWPEIAKKALAAYEMMRERIHR